MGCPRTRLAALALFALTSATAQAADMPEFLRGSISPAYAREQVARVAAARNLPQAEVAKLVESFVRGRLFGYIGEPAVNVLELNIALAKLG